MTGLRVLVVDDEPNARSDLVQTLKRCGVRRIEEAAGTTEALAMLPRGRFDALFLDVRMPGLSGIDLARILNQMPRRPRVVFVTGHPDHAVEAFEEAAIDYLLKPVSEERMRRTLARLDAPKDQPRVGKIPVDVGDRVSLLDAAEVRYARANDDVAYVATNDGLFRTRFTLGELERRLGGASFLRVHRSFLVNVDHILEVNTFFKGALVLRLDDKRHSEIPVSRREAAKLRLLLGL